MKTITYLIAIAMLVSMIAIPIGSTSDDPISEIATSVSSIPDYTEGYGFDVDSMTMTDHNGFEYSYQPDGIIKLVLPWGYTTYFSFGLTGTYLGTPAIRTALDYTWNWDVDCIEFNHTAYTETYIPPVYDAETNTTTEGYYLNESSLVVDGYDYVFLAENSDGVLDWSIQLEFFHEPGKLMKVTHQVTNNYPNAITDIEFWYLFDLSQTPAPYQIETSLGVVYGPLYQPIPNSIHWVRLSNEFQFDWRDTLDTYDNGFAYIGDGSVIGLDGLPILGISLDIGDLASGASFEVDPYFSGVTKTWNAGANGYAGDAANWDPVGHPLVGDNVTFDGTSVYNCNWNLSVTLGDFSMLTGYTGTVTQGLSTTFAINDFVIASGTYAGVPQQNLTLMGDLTKTGGTFATSVLKLRCNGTEQSISQTNTLLGIIVESGSHVTLLTSFTIASYGTGASWPTLGVLWVKTGAVLSIVNTLSIRMYLGNALYINEGEIRSGLVQFLTYNGDRSITPGTLNCNVSLYAVDVSTANWKISLTGSLSCWNLTIGSISATYLGHLDCAGYTVDANILTLDTRGKITQGTGTFTVGNYVQSGAGSVFTQGGDVYSHDFTINGGTFTPIPNKQVNLTGTLTRGASTLPGNVLNCSMNGVGEIITASSYIVFDSLYINANTTIASNQYVEKLYVADNAVLQLSYSLYIQVDSGLIILNNGIIKGAPLIFYGAQDGKNIGIYGSGVTYSPITVYTTSAISNDCMWYLTTNIVSYATLTIKSLDTVYCLTLSLNGYDLDVGNVSIESRGIIDSGNSTITVGTSWTSTSGTFEHDSNTVIFEGTGTLAMATTDSFYNVTIGAGATVTMNTDTYVDCRATILGTMAGTGDFIEPLPAFTSTPDTTLYVGSVWEYTWTQEYWDTFDYATLPGWMIYESDTHTFRGMPNATGFYTISLNLTWNDMVTYQNITLLVEPSEPFMDADFIICFVVLMVLMIMSILGLAVDRLRVLGLFVLFGVAIMAIPIILAFGAYYWIALIFLIACATMSAMNARSNARGK